MARIKYRKSWQSHVIVPEDVWRDLMTVINKTPTSATSFQVGNALERVLKRRKHKYPTISVFS